MIYGYDRVDLSKRIICVEGPIDSLFLPNAVAVGGSDMKKAVEFLPSNEQLAENEYREYAMKRLEALKAAFENAKSELQRQRISIKIQNLARTMKDMGDALPSLEEQSE
jgi:hypothetical protein